MRAIIVGMGRSGKCALYALADLGYELAVQDSKTIDKADPEIREYCKKHNVEEFYGTLPEDFSSYDQMIISPGVDPEQEFVEKARAQGCEVIGELELAYRLSKGTFIGITGTNGKTTTTSLTGEMFKASGRKSTVAGNIGIPVVQFAAQSTPEDWMVTEVSSFQLQTVSTFRPKVAAILNLTPDHLNRHHTMENYGLTKAQIWKNQTEEDYLILNADDPVLLDLCLAKTGMERKAKLALFSRTREVELGAYLKGDMLVIRDEEGAEHPLVDRNELKILGDHNVENALAASAIAFFSGIDTEVISGVLREFPGVEYRLEFVKEINGVKYYNDSKGTNVDATLIALNALKENIILIAGGDAKMQDFGFFATKLKGRVKQVLLFGRDRGMIKEAMDAEGYKDYVELKDLEECVRYAAKVASAGDKVLLSPACASWDMYKDFEVRGRHFKDCVARL